MTVAEFLVAVAAFTLLVSLPVILRYWQLMSKKRQSDETTQQKTDAGLTKREEAATVTVQTDAVPSPSTVSPQGIDGAARQPEAKLQTQAVPGPLPTKEEEASHPTSVSLPEEKLDPLAEYNRCLVKPGLFQVWQNRYRPVLAEVILDELSDKPTGLRKTRRTPSFMIVEVNSELLAFPVFGVSRDYIVDLRYCFDFETIPPSSDSSGFLQKLRRPAKCRRTDDYYALMDRGRGLAVVTRPH
jgi:hypothetical protein